MLQKIAYLATIPLTFAAGLHGLRLYGAGAGRCRSSPRARDAVGRLHDACGSSTTSIMWVIILFTAVHAYLANIYNFAPSRIIFAWKESPGHDYEHYNPEAIARKKSGKAAEEVA